MRSHDDDEMIPRGWLDHEWAQAMHAEPPPDLPLGGVWRDGHICYGDPGPDWKPGDVV